MDKSRLNTAIYRTTHELLAKISENTGESMIMLMDEAIKDLEKKKSKLLDRQTDI